MEAGSHYPSKFQKIHVQHYPVIRHFPGSQAWTPGLHNLSCNGAYVNGGLRGPLLPSSQGSTSSCVSPLLPAFIQAPLEITIPDVLNTFYMTGSQAASTSVTAPIERVKILMQNQGEMIRSGRLSKPYKGIRDCFARTIRNEGFRSLWRGNTADVIRSLSREALNTGFSNCFKGVFYIEGVKYGYWKLLAANLAEGSLVLAATHLFVCPLRFVHTRLANDIKIGGDGEAGKRQFSGMFDLCWKTLKSDGIVGFYRGYNILFAQALLFNYVFEEAVSTFRPGMMLLFQHGFWGTAVAVGAIPILANLVVYPLDTIGRRMMIRSGEAIKYSSSVDAFNQIVKNECSQALYKGAGAGVIQSAISVTAFLLFAKHGGFDTAETLTARWRTGWKWNGGD